MECSESSETGVEYDTCSDCSVSISLAAASMVDIKEQEAEYQRVKMVYENRSLVQQNRKQAAQMRRLKSQNRRLRQRVAKLTAHLSDVKI